MNKKFSYILISLCMLGVLLSPVTPVLQIHNAKVAIEIETRTAKAQAVIPWYYEFSNNGTNLIDGPFPRTASATATTAVSSGCQAAYDQRLAIGVNPMIRNCFQSATPPAVSASGTPPVVDPTLPAGSPGSTAPNPSSDTDLYKNMEDCGLFSHDASVIGCFVIVLYFLLVTIPSFLMSMGAVLFDYMAALTLSSTLYDSSFIQKIWQIIRDFANIFFILILLYAAFQVILGLGSGGKSIVAAVMLVALLVNFSLFVSKVVIDSSNVLALIFYNKIDCKTQDGLNCPNDDKMANPATTQIDQRPIAEALTSKFDVNAFFNADFIKNLPATDKIAGGDKLARTVAISFIAVYGLVAYSLAWVFLVVGLSMLSRLITLMLLMIVSPLAFVTASVPKFRNISTIGFSSWMSQLIETSFVATVFMAILYIVSEILSSQIFKDNSLDQGTLGTVPRLILIFLPALVVVIFLKKGAEYAQKASGAFTGMIMGAATAVGGLALGVATGGAALAGTKFIGGAARRIANDDELKQKAANGDKGAQRKLALANSISKSSFDFRQTKAGKYIGKKSGMDMQAGTSLIGLDSDKFKGGRAGQITRIDEKQEAKMKTYELSKDGTLKQNARNAEYEKDKNIAETKGKKKEEYEEEYKQKVKEFEEKNGAKIKEGDTVFRKNYENSFPPPENVIYDEEKFKAAYQKGDTTTLKEMGVDKEQEYAEKNKAKYGDGVKYEDLRKQDQFKAGGVGNAKKENEERRTAYANSLEDKAVKDEARGAIRTFFAEFKQGAKNMVSTPQGIAATVGAGAISGGGLIPLAIIAGGLRHAFKETWSMSKDREVIASVRKGVDPSKTLADDLKKMMSGGHIDDKKLADLANKITATSATPPASSTPTPAATSGGENHH